MPYSVLHLHSDSAETIEQLGSKPKFWFRTPDDERRWLFKFARPGTGEDWAEKIAPEIAELLGLPHAQIELAKFVDKRGSASPSFVPKGVDLIHGNEILAGHVLGYDASKKFRQSDHTFARIVKAFYDIFPEGVTRHEALTTLAGYLLLDAIICNTDRHHENWALLRSISADGQTSHRIAPTFDHASSLGRELRDEKRAPWLQQKRVADYVTKGTGGVYWRETDAKGANPLALALRATKAHPSYFAPWIQRVKSLAQSEMELVVSTVPDAWMTPIAKEFAMAMLSYTTAQLKQIDA